jgi:hypothetical protein
VSTVSFFTIKGGTWTEDFDEQDDNMETVCILGEGDGEREREGRRRR